MKLMMRFKIKAFTLVEILAVLAIISFVLLFNYTIGMSLSRGFISYTTSKTVIEFLRTSKQLAVLNTENPSEYLLGMVVVFKRLENRGFAIERYKYRQPGNYNYLEYVEPVSFNENFVAMPKSSYNYVKIPLQVGTKFFLGENTTQIGCAGNVIIIFESLFGKPHAYCEVSGNLTNLNLTDKLRIEFSNTKNKIIIKANGEIYGSFKH